MNIQIHGINCESRRYRTSFSSKVRWRRRTWVVSDEDYDNATGVWNHIGCTSLGAYSDLYLKVDVLLSVDVFEKFRDICMNTYHIDPPHYITRCQDLIKLTKVKLSLLHDFKSLVRAVVWCRSASVTRATTIPRRLDQWTYYVPHIPRWWLPNINYTYFRVY